MCPMGQQACHVDEGCSAHACCTGATACAGHVTDVRESWDVFRGRSAWNDEVIAPEFGLDTGHERQKGLISISRTTSPVGIIKLTLEKRQLPRVPALSEVCVPRSQPQLCDLREHCASYSGSKCSPSLNGKKSKEAVSQKCSTAQKKLRTPTGKRRITAPGPSQSLARGVEQMLQQRAAGVPLAIPDSAGLLHLAFMLEPGKSLGAEFMIIGGNEGWLIVSRVSLGLQLSIQASGVPGLLPGDTIIKAGKSARQNPSEITECIKSVARQGGLLDLVVRPRPAEFEAVFLSEPLPNADAKMLGMHVVNDDSEPLHIEVLALHASGLVATWNELHGPPCIMPGDRIIEVNGVREGALKIMERFGIGIQRLHLRVVPPPREFKLQLKDVHASAELTTWPPRGNSTGRLRYQANSSQRQPVKKQEARLGIVI